MTNLGKQPILESPNVFDEMRELPILISDQKAQESLCRFLRYNLGFAWEVLTATEYDKPLLFPFQEIIINGWFKKDYSLFVAGRGLGKSFLIAIFCILYSIFNPKCTIVIISANFRAAKGIFKYIELYTSGKNDSLLKSSFPSRLSKQADRYVLDCANGSQIIGLPLSGEGLRGQRANVLIIDEGLLVSSDVQETVLRPFLASNLSLTEQAQITSLEDQLILEGEMEESERTIFDKNKLIICSSASFQFEHLYKGIFLPYIKTILEEHEGRIKDPSYFVCRASYHIGLKHNIIQEEVIKAAQDAGAEGAQNPLILKEYCARFVDVSGGFFNIEFAKKCIFENGQSPTLQLKGNKNSQYILAIDPSYASEKNSDFFAMSVCLLNYEEKKITLVHSYGRAGAELSDHYEYLVYILKNFNIVFLIIDATSTDALFIKQFNESSIAKENKLKLDFLEVDFEVEDIDYEKELIKAKNQWNINEKKIVYKHLFGGNTNRKTNEYLQGQLQARKVWFGSRINMHSGILDNYHANFEMPYKFKDELGTEFEGVQEFIDWQDSWVEKTINQLAGIQVTISSAGTMRFDLPSHSKNEKDKATRSRKDNYTTLMLAVYAAKHLFGMTEVKDDRSNNDFHCVAF